jgi:nicotinate-nucleotide adenylyltransferase
MMRPPLFGEGQRIGLFGGSFNPAHKGHRAVALYALKRFELDWVWWLVAPQNPLKDASETGEYAERLAYTRLVARHPRFVVTDLEKQLGARYTAATLRAMAPLLAKARFVWILGADSFADLHRWHDWLKIPATVPLAILARPGYSLRALASPAAIRFQRQRLRTANPALLAKSAPPAWMFLAMPLRPESSTAIRKHRKAVKKP